MLTVREHPPHLDTWLSVLGGREQLRGLDVVGNSRATAAVLAERLGRAEGDIPVIYPPVRMPPPRPIRTDRRPLVILGVGTVSKRKGADVFLDVARHLRDRDGVTFVWLGDGPLLGPLRRRAAASGASVEFAGPVDDATPHYLAAAVVLVPSRAEPFSRVAVEALANGAPVVASNVGGLREAVGSGGLVVDAEADVLARAIVELIDDPDRRRELADRGGREVRARFTVEAYRAAMGPRIERLIVEARTPAAKPRS